MGEAPSGSAAWRCRTASSCTARRPGAAPSVTRTGRCTSPPARKPHLRARGAAADADPARPARPCRGVCAPADGATRAAAGALPVRAAERARRDPRHRGRGARAPPLATLCRRAGARRGRRRVPAGALALRGPDLAAYHGAEHISIGTYENGGMPAPKEHPRCGSQLIAPMVATSLAANVVARRRPPARGASRGSSGRWRDRRLGRGLLVGRTQPVHPLARVLARPGIRAPAPPLDRGAVGRSARGRERRARRLSRARART